MNIIKTSAIPQARKSQVPELLKQIPAGQTGELTQKDTPYKLSTITTYINNAHEKKQLLNYTYKQRTNKETKEKTLYIIREPEPKCKETAKTATPA